MSIDFLLMFSQIYYILGRKSIDMNKVQFISQQGVPKSSENKASFSPYLLISWHIYTQTNLLDSLETEVLARKKEDGVFLGTPQLFSYWWRWHLSCQIVFFLLIKFFQASISIFNLFLVLYSLYPLCSILNAASWITLLCFCICCSHRETPSLHSLVSSCSFSGMWLRCLGSCCWPLPTLSWVSIQCASRIPCIYLYMGPSKLPWCNHLPLLPDCVIPEHRNCLSYFVSPALGRYYKQSWKLTFFDYLLHLMHVPTFYLLTPQS